MSHHNNQNSINDYILAINDRAIYSLIEFGLGKELEQ